MNIKEYLNQNKNIETSKKYNFQDFIEFYKTEKLSWEDLTILKYSDNYYIVQCYWLSKAQILLENNWKKIDDNQLFFLNSIVSESNLINPRKLDKTFPQFLFDEMKIRVISFIIIIVVFLIIPLFWSSGLLEVSKKILEISIWILWVYLSVMIVFVNTDWFKYNKYFFESWKISYYFNTDKNLAKMALYSILYLFFLYVVLYIFWGNWLKYNILRYIWFWCVWFWFFIVYLNFVNLIDFYIDKFTYLKFWEYKDNFFRDNYLNKNK